jgi:hypothetical protein
MPIVKCHISMSLDGYTAGPNQSIENPLGEGGEELHCEVRARPRRRRAGRHAHQVPDRELAAGSILLRR